MAEYTINLPATDEDVEKLNIGDTVYINGTVCTARDMAHLQMRELVENGKELPENIAGGAIFHAGPVMKKDENDQWKLRVIGPTTSIRMEPHADFMGRMGVKLIIGKGGMGEDSLAAFKKYKQAYLQAAPGCAVVLAAGIKEADKFGPFVVTMDCKGNSRYNDVKVKAREIAEDILSKK